MKRIGALPKIFGKCNISRYNSSHDAEYKNTSTSETMHYRWHYSTIGQPPYVSRWTTKNGYPVFILSNQGFIGTPGSVFFEEDFRAILQAYEAYAIRGGYCILRNSTGTTDAALNLHCCFYMGDGTQVSAALTAVQVSEFTPEQISFSGGYFREQKQEIVNGHGPGIPLTDQSAMGRDSYDSHRYQGKYVSGGGYISSTVNHLSGYNCYAGYVSLGNRRFRLCIQTPTETSWGGETLVSYAGALPVAHYNYSSYELFHLPPNMTAFSTENKKYISGGTYGNPAQRFVGRYMLRIPVGSNQVHKLLYYDADEDVIKECDLSEFEPAVSLYLTAATNFSNYGLFGSAGETNFAYLRTYDLAWSASFGFYYKNTLLSKWADVENKAYCTFGTWYMEYGTRILRNAETDEVIDLSGVLPEPVVSNDWDVMAGSMSSGIYGKMAIYWPTAESGEGKYQYVITKDAVFRMPLVDTNLYSGQVILWPVQKHMERVYLFFEQVVYVISEKEFRAYDMQTFLRLDNLPNFESAVEKIWERPA